MAVDTRDKRASAIFLNLDPLRLYPNPDGSIANANDRAHMAWLYSGLAVTATAAAAASYRTLVGVGI